MKLLDYYKNELLKYLNENDKEVSNKIIKYLLDQLDVNTIERLINENSIEIKKYSEVNKEEILKEFYSIEYFDLDCLISYNDWGDPDYEYEASKTDIIFIKQIVEIALDYFKNDNIDLAYDIANKLLNFEVQVNEIDDYYDNYGGETILFSDCYDNFGIDSNTYNDLLKISTTYYLKYEIFNQLIEIIKREEIEQYVIDLLNKDLLLKSKFKSYILNNLKDNSLSNNLMIYLFNDKESLFSLILKTNLERYISLYLDNFYIKEDKDKIINIFKIGLNKYSYSNEFYKKVCSLFYDNDLIYNYYKNYEEDEYSTFFIYNLSLDKLIELNIETNLNNITFNYSNYSKYRLCIKTIFNTLELKDFSKYIIDKEELEQNKNNILINLKYDKNILLDKIYEFLYIKIKDSTSKHYNSLVTYIKSIIQDTNSKDFLQKLIIDFKNRYKLVPLLKSLL